MPHETKIAYFVTPHGFGHASRASAVMKAVIELMPEVRFELFTTCPEWIFKDSLQSHFGYHAVYTDVGLVQSTPLEENLPATCKRLDGFLPFDPALVDDLAGQLTRQNCRLVICDIAPLGIAAARKAGLPSVLVENFTWDWIYASYLSSAPGLKPHVNYLKQIFSQVDHHIQTQPLCRPVDAALSVGPISRKPRTNHRQVRRRLGIPDTAQMVLISMGGVPDRFEFLQRLPKDLDLFLVIPGVNNQNGMPESVIPLPVHSDFFHPDLMAAADVLIGKAGYSTVAEAYRAGIPFGYLNRPHFCESAVLENFIVHHLPARHIKIADYRTGRWIEMIPELLALPRSKPSTENSADAVARYICSLL